MKIAIQGHPTKGKEVIRILESLGGKNTHALYGNGKDYEYYYHINSCGTIALSLKYDLHNCKLYTLEEFEKEFPFKVGDEVIFPVKIGWASGKVTSLTYREDKLKYEVDTRIGGYQYVESHKLRLYPMKKERNITLTLDKAKEWYNKGGELKEVALQAYSEEELIKVELPKSWEEFRDNNPVQKGECFLSIRGSIEHAAYSCNRRYRNWIPSDKSAEAHLAMIQLEQLRECWWNGWEPEWNNSEKYVIKWEKDDLIVFTARRIHAFLAFPTREMAEEFLECFRDLIEKAGDLI